MNNLSRKEMRERERLKKSLTSNHVNNMAHTMFELRNQKVIDTYHSVRSRLGLDLPPFHIEYDKKYFYFHRCIYKRDCQNT